jgi:hypothetical protein
VDTVAGTLSYLPSDPHSVPASALLTDFVHLGSGTDVTGPVSGGFASPPTGTFNWLGNLSQYWLACPDGASGYLVSKLLQVNAAPGCVVLQLAALDH